MSVEVSGDAYDRFMGRYSRPLAPQRAEFAGVAAGQRVLDVGSGPGALTAELVGRVTRAGGVVAACVWDHAGERSPLAVFWRAARELDPGVHDETDLAGAREGHLVALLRAAGLEDVVAGELEAPHTHASFEAWWDPFLLGVGPAGAYVAGLSEDARDTLRERCRALLAAAPPAVVAARGVITLG